MSIISEVKCARCDRKYSGVRSRCPYCGARRIGRGKYSEEADNSKGKMLIGIMIMSVLVVAAAILLFTTPADEEGNLGASAANPSSPVSSMPDESDNITEEGNNVPPAETPPEDTEPPMTPAAPEVRAVFIVYGSNNRVMEDFTVKVGEKVPLRVRIEPMGVLDEIIWSTSNRGVFDIVPDNTEGTAATVHGLGRGTATLTVSVGGVEATCIVRGRNPG